MDLQGKSMGATPQTLRTADEHASTAMFKEAWGLRGDGVAWRTAKKQDYQDASPEFRQLPQEVKHAAFQGDMGDEAGARARWLEAWGRAFPPVADRQREPEAQPEPEPQQQQDASPVPAPQQPSHGGQVTRSTHASAQGLDDAVATNQRLEAEVSRLRREKDAQRTEIRALEAEKRSFERERDRAVQRSSEQDRTRQQLTARAEEAERKLQDADRKLRQAQRDADDASATAAASGRSSPAPGAAAAAHVQVLPRQLASATITVHTKFGQAGQRRLGHGAFGQSGSRGLLAIELDTIIFAEDNDVFARYDSLFVSSIICEYACSCRSTNQSVRACSKGAQLNRHLCARFNRALCFVRYSDCPRPHAGKRYSPNIFD